jgi:antitoxin HicB
MALPYTYELRRNDDGTWFACVRDLPGCMTEGDTQAEALEMLEDAMRSWLEVAIERGLRIPEPRPEPAYSGRFVVRVPKSLHRALAERARSEGTSLNQLVVAALAEASAKG